MTELLTLISTMLIGAIANVGTEAVKHLLRRLGITDREQGFSYEERMATLTASVAKASSDMDRVIKEMATVGQERLGTIRKLEVELAQLQQKEQSLRTQIEALTNTPLPVADYFAGLVEQGSRKGERRSAWRDYILFAAGVVASIMVTFALKKLGY